MSADVRRRRVRRDRFHRRPDGGVPRRSRRRHALGPGRAQPRQARAVQLRLARSTRGPPTSIARGGRHRPVALRRVAESTKVVITTVGPYIRYGEPLVAACAEAGTDYVDSAASPSSSTGCGSPSRPRRRDRRAAGPPCGFDSIPHDLGVLYTVARLPEGVPITSRGSCAPTQRSPVAPTTQRSRSSVGCVRPARSPASAAHSSLVPPAAQRHGLTAAPARRPRRRRVIAAPRSIRHRGVAQRTALERYGPEFRYAHYIVIKRLPARRCWWRSARAAGALAQVKPTRDLLLRVKDQGDGPSAANARSRGSTCASRARAVGGA